VAFALLVQVPASVGYWLVFLLVAAETAGALVPGETALIVAASLAGQGKLSLALVWACATSGAILGDSLGYLIGARGLRLLARRFGPGLVRRGELFFARHGPKAVFLARWIPGLRLVGAWFAGAARMPWRRFLPWNALGGIAWAASIAVTADLIGHAAGSVFGAIGAVLAAATLLVAGSFVWRRRLPRRSD
jgi:membrane protein DedA with SNARE-associated domain